MAQFRRIQVYNTLLEQGLVPLFYHHDLPTARQVIAALQAGGTSVVEFTNRGDSAFEVFSNLSQAVPGLILGVGSVLDAPTAALFIAAGANFIVGPAFNPEVARLCNRRKIAYLPGCATVSEISAAEEMGAEIVKIFPGETLGGPAFVKAVLAPLPWANLMPTGGVDATEESIHKWFKAGVCAVGMGSNLVSKDAVASGNFNRISERTAQVLAWIRAARSA
jgi:2-dehydro-3-deoxyphosphogluconate aldolase/(4S)-4-hydroxy-2-oxoglutarate aldolase